MFPVRLLQPSYSPLCVCREAALSPRSGTRLMADLLEDDMMHMMKSLERRMNCVNQLLARDMEQRDHLNRSSVDSDRNTSTTDKEGKDNFDLTLEVKGFTPEELTVKTEGRRLIVSEKHDKKSSENGGYFHEYREWRREAELPQDVNPEDILCSLSKDGQLRLQAPRLVLPAAEERPISINVTQSPEDGQQKIQSKNPEGEKELNSS
ncbi:heat shock protein 30C-like [Eleutherodactylus coqui]|uniref:heat shock protein 30C-like n=1 Tax=Eleutherodactylus coqui TaxID=57060 RepID=UPI0034621100